MAPTLSIPRLVLPSDVPREDYATHSQWLLFLANYRRELDRLERDVRGLTRAVCSPPRSRSPSVRSRSSTSPSSKSPSTRNPATKSTTPSNPSTSNPTTKTTTTKNLPRMNTQKPSLARRKDLPGLPKARKPHSKTKASQELSQTLIPETVNEQVVKSSENIQSLNEIAADVPFTRPDAGLVDLSSITIDQNPLLQPQEIIALSTLPQVLRPVVLPECTTDLGVTPLNNNLQKIIVLDEARKIKERNTEDHIRSLVFHDHQVDSPTALRATNTNALFSGGSVNLTTDGSIFGPLTTTTTNPVNNNDNHIYLQKMQQRLAEKSSSISALNLKVKQLERELRWLKLERTHATSTLTVIDSANNQLSHQSDKEINCDHDIDAIDSQMRQLQARLQRQFDELKTLEDQNHLLKIENCRLIEQETLVKNHLRHEHLQPKNSLLTSSVDPASLKALLSKIDDLKSKLLSCRSTFDTHQTTTTTSSSVADYLPPFSSTLIPTNTVTNTDIWSMTTSHQISTLIDTLATLRTVVLTTEDLKQTTVAGYVDLVDHLQQLVIEYDQLATWRGQHPDDPITQQITIQQSNSLDLQDNNTSSRISDAHMLAELNRLQTQNASYKDEIRRLYTQQQQNTIPLDPLPLHQNNNEQHHRTLSWTNSTAIQQGHHVADLLRQIQSLQQKNLELKMNQSLPSLQANKRLDQNTIVQDLYMHLKRVETELENIKTERNLSDMRTSNYSQHPSSVKLDFVLPVNNHHDSRSRSKSDSFAEIASRFEPELIRRPNHTHIDVMLPAPLGSMIGNGGSTATTTAAAATQNRSLDVSAISNVLDMHRVTQQKLCEATERIGSLELELVLAKQKSTTLEEQLDDMREQYEDIAIRQKRQSGETNELERDHTRRVELLKDEINELTMTNREKEGILTQMQERIVMYEDELTKMEEHIESQNRHIHEQIQSSQLEQVKSATTTTAMLERLMTAIQESYQVNHKTSPVLETNTVSATSQMIDMLKTLLTQQQHSVKQQSLEQTNVSTGNGGSTQNSILVAELREAVAQQVVKSKELKSENERLHHDNIVIQQRCDTSEARAKNQEAEMQIQLQRVQDQLDVTKLRVVSLEKCLEQYRIQYKGIQRLQAGDATTHHRRSIEHNHEDEEDGALVSFDLLEDELSDYTDTPIREEKRRYKNGNISARPFPFFVAFTHLYKQCAHLRRQLRTTQQQVNTLQSELEARQIDLVAARKQVEHVSSLLGTAATEHGHERLTTRQQHEREIESMRRQCTDLTTRLQQADVSKKVLQAQLGRVVNGVGAYLKGGLLIDEVVCVSSEVDHGETLHTRDGPGV